MKNTAIANRLEQLNPEYREYILSGEPQEIAKVFSESHNFTKEQEIVLENGYSLYLMFFINLTDFSTFITTECNFPEKDAVLLARAMHLAIPEDIRKIHEETTTLIFSIDSNLNKEKQLASEISETEATISGLESIRTMAGDSEHAKPEEIVHSSSQSSILN